MELYVHFPFCRQKCRYCDFVSFPGQEDLAEAYMDSLLQEAEVLRDEITEPVTTVYYGGGTPSIIPADILRKVTERLKKILPLDCVLEWTAESNPGTLTETWLNTAVESGINRLSVGMQSSRPDLLHVLGRIHQMDEVESSVDMARRAGFRNISLDLMFGIPMQTLSDWQETLDRAFGLDPEHLSAYGLIPEEGTPLWKDIVSGRLVLPEEETERRMYDMLLDTASRHGFAQYEISNFARPGFRCRHNIGYWRQIPYLGLGVSAASMLRLRKSPDGVTYLRRTNTDSLSQYLSDTKNILRVFAEEEWISPAEAEFETLMLGLRMNEGISEKEWRIFHGSDLSDRYGDKLIQLSHEGLISCRAGTWALTRRGMDVQNTVLVQLMD